jgi:hypothetical protein
LLAKRLGETVFQLLCPGGKTKGALLGVEQVGLEGSTADDWPDAWCTGRLCL